MISEKGKQIPKREPSSYIKTNSRITPSRFQQTRQARVTRRLHKTMPSRPESRGLEGVLVAGLWTAPPEELPWSRELPGGIRVWMVLEKCNITFIPSQDRLDVSNLWTSEERREPSEIKGGQDQQTRLHLLPSAESFWIYQTMVNHQYTMKNSFFTKGVHWIHFTFIYALKAKMQNNGTCLKYNIPSPQNYDLIMATPRKQYFNMCTVFVIWYKIR